jgi:hypothetical protein
LVNARMVLERVYSKENIQIFKKYLSLTKLFMRVRYLSFHLACTV